MQNNLGIALKDLEDAEPSGGRHLRGALTCYENALRVRCGDGGLIAAIKRVRRKLIDPGG